MKIFNKKLPPHAVAAVLAIAVSIIICVTVFSCSSKRLRFKSAFYFVCYRTQDNSVSASSVSGAVSSYGGAGYILEYGNAFYITVACYYNELNANTVCESLKRRDLNCEVLKVETEEYALQSFAGENEEKLYTGNLKTLYSLSSIAYECANSIDKGEYGQSQAKSVIYEIEKSLNSLLRQNANNAFSPHIKRLIAECNEISEGYIYSKDLRKLQIAAADAIINIKLY